MWRVLWWVSYLYTAKKTCLGAQLNSARCAQFKQKQRKVNMREINCKWLRMSNIS